MLNSVRNMVLGILKKHNYGHLPVSDFNQFAKHAQLFIFEQLQDNLNDYLNKEIARLSGSGLASMTQHVKEELDKFNRNADTLTHIAGNTWNMPTEATTGFDSFKLRHILVYDASGYIGEAEYLSGQHKHTIINSPYMQPSTSAPLYTIDDEVVTLYPATIDKTITPAYEVKADYLRYPKDPNWTFTTIGTNGEEIFNPSNADYQDFELSKELEYLLAAKICQMAGINIREMMVYQYATQEEIKSNPPQQTYRR